MRSLVLCPYLPFPPDHGGRIRSGLLCEALASRTETVIAAPVPMEEWSDAMALARDEGVELVPLPAQGRPASPRHKLSNWLRGRSELLEHRWSAEARQMAAELCRADFDWIVVDSTFAWPLLPSKVEAKVMLHLHDVESAVLRRTADRAHQLGVRLPAAIEERQIGRIEARAAQRADLVLVVSASDAELLRRLAPEVEPVVIHNSVDLDLLRPLPPAEATDPVLLLVGSFDYPPNVEAAFELVEHWLPALRLRWPKAKARLVGRDPGGRIAELARHPGVERAGFVDSLDSEYRRAQVVALPIRTGGGNRLKAIEAFALGRAVVSTAIGVESLDVVADRHYLRAETPQEVVVAVDRVLSGRAEGIIRAARELVEERYARSQILSRIGSLL